jgi:hypothetical protein
MTIENAGSLPPPRPPYGYFGTLGWALLAALVSIAGSAVALAFWYPSMLGGDDTFELKYDALLFSRLTVASTIAQLALIAVAVKVRRCSLYDYLVLVFQRSI